MREVKQIQVIPRAGSQERVGEIAGPWKWTEDQRFLGICTDDTLWLGVLHEDEEVPVVEWHLLNGPPDGELYWNKAKSFWDRMEEKYKNEAKDEG